MGYFFPATSLPSFGLNKLYYASMSEPKPIHFIEDNQVAEVNYPEKLKPVPEEWKKFVLNFRRMVDAGKLSEFSGLSETSDAFTLFHATKASHLSEIIVDGGIRSFSEPGRKTSRIFGTLSPSSAIWHGENNGPHDTERKNKGDVSSHKQDETVLLVFSLPKSWLLDQPETRDERALPGYLKTQKGISGDSDTRLASFREMLADETSLLEKGEEGNSIGIPLPVDTVPMEYIYVLDKERGTVTPLK